MTSPVNSVQQGGSRFYVDPTDGKRLPSVTSVLSMLPKDLSYWAALQAADFAIDHLDEVAAMVSQGNREGARRMIATASQRYANSASEVGTHVHALCEAMALAYVPGQPVQLPERVLPGTETYVGHFAEFLERHQPIFHQVECSMWDPNGNGVAGSADAVATLTAGPLAGMCLALDWKTTKQPRSEVALQLHAYRRAEWIIQPDGTKIPNVETDGGAILWLRPEGWHLIPVETEVVDLGGGQTVDLSDVFSAARLIFDWEKYAQRRVLLDSVDQGGELERKTSKPRAVKAETAQTMTGSAPARVKPLEHMYESDGWGDTSLEGVRW